MLLAQVSSNQRAVIEPLVSRGAAWALGPDDLAGPTALEAALRRLVGAGEPALQAMSLAGASLIDGQGARRVAAALAARISAPRGVSPR
jgi:hypothetical protein